MEKLRKLKEERRSYMQLSWESKNGVSTRIIDLTDDHLINVLRNVGQKLYLAEKFPKVVEFQEYNNVSYKTYADALYSEYLYREAIMEARYNEYIEQQIYEQSVLDEKYYDDRYDYGEVGGCF